MIVAADNKNGIGKNNTLPWPNNSADMKHFKEITTDTVMVMGSSTWDSLPKKPLPNRINVVVSTRDNITGADKVMSGNAKDIIYQLKDEYQDKCIMIIGGANLIDQLYDIVDTFHFTRIDGEYDCDTFIDVDKYTSNLTLTCAEQLAGLTFETWSRLTDETTT